MSLGCGPAEEDELYEDYIAETNAVYEVMGSELNPIVEFSGQVPRYDMLSDDKVYLLIKQTDVFLQLSLDWSKLLCFTCRCI